MTNAALRTVTLPTGRLLGAAWIGCLSVGFLWTAAAWLLGASWPSALSGLAAGGVVAVAAAAVLIVIRPWRAKTLAEWPVVWVAGSLARLAVTLGGTFLLYSATRFGGKSLWLAVAAAYLAAMIGETRIYGASMRRFDPGPGKSSPQE